MQEIHQYYMPRANHKKIWYYLQSKTAIGVWVFLTYMLLNLSISTWCDSWTPTISLSSEPLPIGTFPLSESILNHEYPNGDPYLHRRSLQWNTMSKPMSGRFWIQGIHKPNIHHSLHHTRLNRLPRRIINFDTNW